MTPTDMPRRPEAPASGPRGLPGKAKAPSAAEPSPRSFRPFLGFGVVVFLAILATAGYKSWRDLAAAHARESELELQIAAAQARLEALERRSDLLRRDPATLERLAREELGMVRPGDVVIVLPEDEAPAGAAPAAPTP